VGVTISLARVLKSLGLFSFPVNQAIDQIGQRKCADDNSNHDASGEHRLVPERIHVHGNEV
jgi:hypothetical protein